MYFEGVHHLQTKHDDKIKPVPGHPLPMEQNKWTLRRCRDQPTMILNFFLGLDVLSLRPNTCQIMLGNLSFITICFEGFLIGICNWWHMLVVWTPATWGATMHCVSVLSSLSCSLLLVLLSLSFRHVHFRSLMSCIWINAMPEHIDAWPTIRCHMQIYISACPPILSLCVCVRVSTGNMWARLCAISERTGVRCWYIYIYLHLPIFIY